MPIPVRIVLVGTSHPGNIGASARAMKTMGLDELVLVAPRDFPSADATARASGADDVLARARSADSLADAIADCGFVAGASARPRRLAWPVADPRAGASGLLKHARATKVAMVFGPEHSGLTNEDLGRCNQVVHIPANPAYSSLNVAMAVQVLCYELRMAALEHQADAGPATPGFEIQEPAGVRRATTQKPDAREKPPADARQADARSGNSERADPVPADPEPVDPEPADPEPAGKRQARRSLHGPESPPATAGELEGFYHHLETALGTAGFLMPNRSRQLKLRLRRIFQRSGLDRNEINILRGALSALEGSRKEG